jgi:hypothetical protein
MSAARDRTPRPRSGNEGSCIDEHGKKADADFHEPILEGVHPEADKRHRIKSFRRAVERHGIPVERAARLYGLEPSDIMVALKQRKR